MARAPDTLDLIATARTALKAEVLPGLGPREAYVVRMALNALGIAGRQIATGAARRQAAGAALVGFAAGASPEAMAAALARDIRAGRVPLSPELHAVLCAIARAETEESAPRARILRG